MYPIQQSKLIQPSDFYTHFLLAAIPLNVGGSSFTLVSNHTVKSKTVTLPVSINLNNLETWKIDAYIYGLNAVSSSATTVTSRSVLKITFGSNLNWTDFTPTQIHRSTDANKEEPTTMRHDQFFFGGQYKGGIAYQLIAGQKGNMESPQIEQGTGIDYEGFASSTSAFSTITLQGMDSDYYPNVTIGGLYLEFTRLAPANPTNTTNVTIL